MGYDIGREGLYGVSSRGIYASGEGGSSYGECVHGEGALCGKCGGGYSGVRGSYVIPRSEVKYGSSDEMERSGGGRKGVGSDLPPLSSFKVSSLRTAA